MRAREARIVISLRAMTQFRYSRTIFTLTARADDANFAAVNHCKFIFFDEGFQAVQIAKFIR